MTKKIKKSHLYTVMSTCCSIYEGNWAWGMQVFLVGHKNGSLTRTYVGVTKVYNLEKYSYSSSNYDPDSPN